MLKKSRIALVILAAGKSTRFPGNKLLAKVNDESMIEKIVKTSIKSKVDEIIVVTGHEADKIEKTLYRIRDDRIKLVYNVDYEKGQSSSVKKGLSEVIDRVDAVIIHPADVPFITPEDIDNLVNVYEITSASIIVASHKGRHGHPILFSNKLFNEIMNITEEKKGLKELTDKYREEIIEVESSQYTVTDVDTVEDLEKLLKSMREP